MNFPLILCLLAACVARGMSLSCETCQAFGNYCNGNLANCPPDEDSCAFMQISGAGVMQTKIFAKMCISSINCVQPLASVNLGKAGQILSQITCCDGTNCPKAPPAMPPINTTPNGKKCPACYAVHSVECEDHTIECAGDENYCFEITGTANLGGVTGDMVMKGCTSSVSCNRTQASGSFGSFSSVTKTFCIPATGSASFVRPLFGFLLQAFIGLLLLKVLS